MEGSCDEYDGIERAIVSQGYEGLSRNYHPDNIHFTFFSVDHVWIISTLVHLQLLQDSLMVRKQS